jgi:gentisate 1,2-dioxygenase
MTAAEPAGKREAALKAFLAGLERINVVPLWSVVTASREPVTPVQPYIWRWRDYYPELMRSAEFMAPAPVQGEERDERRAFLFVNPGLREHYATTNTLIATAQLILPGEIAPAHRHSAAAVRFMIQGRAYTTVQGEKVEMAPGDLVLTPQWTWHDHANESSDPVIWMDGLDRLLIQQLNVGFFDPYPSGRQELSKPLDYSVRKYGPTNVRPLSDRPPPGPASSPQILYKWAETQAALKRLHDLGEKSRFGEVAVYYVNPLTGSHATSTMGCSAHLLGPSARTKAKRVTGSSVYHVASGRGFTIVNGTKIVWEKGDSLAVPPWAWHEHGNASDKEEAFLFCLDDSPVFQSLGLFLEEPYQEADGHQSIRSEM